MNPPSEVGILWPMVTFRRVVFVLFVVVQGVFPLWAIVGGGPERRTDFTWDMFAVRRDCAECEISYVVGDGPAQRVSWGLRAPRLGVIEESGGVLEARDIDGMTIDALGAFEAHGRGVLLAHPDRPALNVRAGPQVARLKTTRRLGIVGAELCAALEDLYLEALDGGLTPRWAHAEAAEWERSGRRLSVYAVCECGYNGGETIEVIDPALDLCEPR